MGFRQGDRGVWVIRPKGQDEGGRFLRVSYQPSAVGTTIADCVHIPAPPPTRVQVSHLKGGQRPHLEQNRMDGKVADPVSSAQCLSPASAPLVSGPKSARTGGWQDWGAAG